MGVHDQAFLAAGSWQPFAGVDSFAASELDVVARAHDPS